MLGRWACALGLAALAVSGCTAPPPPPTDADACYARLRAVGVLFEPIPDVAGRDGCGVTAALRMSQGAVPWSRPGVVTCAFAETLQDFEAAIVQPTAQAIFGQPVRRIHHMGTYSCRKRNGAAYGRLSEHAFGRAIDIRSFELADGTVIDVGQHWWRAGKRTDFLRAVAKGACSRFAVVLTPNSDAAHRDHLHLDSGTAGRLCGA